MCEFSNYLMNIKYVISAQITVYKWSSTENGVKLQIHVSIPNGRLVTDLFVWCIALFPCALKANNQILVLDDKNFAIPTGTRGRLLFPKDNHDCKRVQKIDLVLLWSLCSICSTFSNIRWKQLILTKEMKSIETGNVIKIWINRCFHSTVPKTYNYQHAIINSGNINTREVTMPWLFAN